MLGPIIIVVVLVVFIPVGVFLSGSLAAAILGWAAKADVDDDFEGTEYIELGR